MTNRKLFFLGLIIFLVQNLHSQVTFVINTLPNNCYLVDDYKNIPSDLNLQDPDNPPECLYIPPKENPCWDRGVCYLNKGSGLYPLRWKIKSYLSKTKYYPIFKTESNEINPYEYGYRIKDTSNNIA